MLKDSPVSKDGDEIVQVSVRANEWLDGDVNGACFAVGMMAREESFKDNNTLFPT